MGETGVMRDIQLCSMANWSLCSGVDEDEGGEKFIQTLLHWSHFITICVLCLIVVIMLLYHNLDITATSGEWSSGGRVHSQSRREGINDN